MSVLVSVDSAGGYALVRGVAREETHGRFVNTSDFAMVGSGALCCAMLRMP